MTEVNWDKMDMIALGEKLYNLRKEKGMTQEEFIEGTGITYRTYSKYERGKIRPKENQDNLNKLLIKHGLLHLKKEEETISAYVDIKTENGYVKGHMINKPVEKVKIFLELVELAKN